MVLLDWKEIDLDQENNQFETITFNVVIAANGFGRNMQATDQLSARSTSVRMS
jgi:hypothetical protein